MLEFFDGDVGVGYSGLGKPAFATPGAAAHGLARYGIRRALVYDRGAVESGRFDRFDDILDFCRGSDRFLPTVAASPPACGEGPPPAEFAAMLLAHGIKAVRLWPQSHGYAPDPFAFGKLFEILEQRRLPVIIHLTEEHPWSRRSYWQEVRETAQAFPALPIVVLQMGMRDSRQAFPLLDGCLNVLLDLTCVSFCFIEYAVERWGSRRLVLASHHPCHDPGIYTSWIAYSGIPRQAKEDIAWRNWEILMEGAA